MITVEDIAYVRVAVDDLQAQERFLLDFGMHRVERTDHALYMRGAGTQPVIHISEPHTDDFRPGVGFIAASLAELERFSAAAGAPVQENTEPGGGAIVRLIDPSGYRVEVLHRPPVQALPVRTVKSTNYGSARAGYARFNEPARFQHGPSHVLRLGHAALIANNCDESFRWYSRHFNFQVSDSYYSPHGDKSRHLVIFARCGLGKKFTDHHTLVFIDASAFKELPERGFDHTAYEVLDWDDVMLGHDFLQKGGYKHSFGVGRHIAGGMVFDYWRDSAGNKLEHWADGDFVNDDYESMEVPAGSVPFKSWGPEVSADFFVQKVKSLAGR
jgi:catechol 2,3-dioxygenase-like lactoylglutathione lyase family enzyme